MPINRREFFTGTVWLTCYDRYYVLYSFRTETITNVLCSWRTLSSMQRYRAYSGFPQLLPCGQRDLCGGSASPVCCVCVIPWEGPFYALALLRCQSVDRRACDSGQGRHPWRTGLCLCMLHKKKRSQYPARCPPRPFTLSHPAAASTARPVPPSPRHALAASHPAYQKYAWRNNGRFYAHGTWNVSECGRPGSLSSLRASFVPPYSPERERDRKVTW